MAGPNSPLGISAKSIRKDRTTVKRSRTSVACIQCKFSKTKCSEYRPCKQCVTIGASHRCADNVPRLAAPSMLMPKTANNFAASRSSAFNSVPLRRPSVGIPEPISNIHIGSFFNVDRFNQHSSIFRSSGNNSYRGNVSRALSQISQPIQANPQPFQLAPYTSVPEVVCRTFTGTSSTQRPDAEPVDRILPPINLLPSIPQLAARWPERSSVPAFATQLGSDPPSAGGPLPALNLLMAAALAAAPLPVPRPA